MSICSYQDDVVDAAANASLMQTKIENEENNVIPKFEMALKGHTDKLEQCRKIEELKAE